jgi:hypothetical protein
MLEEENGKKEKSALLKLLAIVGDFYPLISLYIWS